MTINRNRLYTFLSLSCLAGYIWLFVTYRFFANSDNGVIVCLFRRVTGIPCPSCGSTRSALAFFNGEFLSSLYWNPIGVILAIIMLVTPVWISIDLVLKKDSLFIFFRKTELVFQKKYVAIPAVVLIMANWIWNIIKGV
jgi:hypothetical protein